MKVCAMAFVRACFYSFRMQMTGFHDLLREKAIFPVHFIWLELNVLSLP